MAIMMTPTIMALIQIATEAAIKKLFLDVEGKTEEEQNEILAKLKAEKDILDARLASH